MNMIGQLVRPQGARRNHNLFLKAANVLESISQHHSVKISRSSYRYYLSSFFLSSGGASFANRLPIKLHFGCKLPLVKLSRIHHVRPSFSATSRCRCSQQSAEERNRHRNVQERERERTVVNMPRVQGAKE